MIKKKRITGSLHRRSQLSNSINKWGRNWSDHQEWRITNIWKSTDVIQKQCLSVCLHHQRLLLNVSKHVCFSVSSKLFCWSNNWMCGSVVSKDKTRGVAPAMLYSSEAKLNPLCLVSLWRNLIACCTLIITTGTEVHLDPGAFLIQQNPFKWICDVCFLCSGLMQWNIWQHTVPRHRCIK